MRIQKRLIGLLLVLAIALGLVGMTAASAEAFAGEIKDGILVKYTGDKYALTADDFPESVKVIGSSAFKGLPMTSVVIPNRVTSIGASAFEDCAQLTGGMNFRGERAETHPL